MSNKKSIPPNRNSPYIQQDGKPNDEFYNWMQTVSSLLNGIEGEGSPVGVIDAVRLTMYVNILTNDVWIKRTPQGDTAGWLLL
jgi:hypothetical protein